MEAEIRYKPAFAAIFVTLHPGDSITAEAGAMISMDAQVSIQTKFAGGLFPAFLKKWFGGESLFVNVFTNKTAQPLTVVLTQSNIGDIEQIDLSQGGICLQPGTYIAHTSGVKLGVRWAGFSSWVSGEGLFKLRVSGQGKVFFGAYGGITKKRINGEFIVDSGHLIAYSPSIKLRLGLSGGLLGSITSKEGLVSRLSGQGEVYMQSRSLDGLVRYLRTKL